jgi:HAD superfamily hydrolase (TIGR01484 family)
MEQNRIIFFSDIDDTLLFSKRKIDFRKEVEIGAWNRENEPFSYFYKEVKFLLDSLLKLNITFIPNSARNFDSYKRTIFYNHPDVKYAILNFGGLILENNQVDKKWNKMVKKKMKNIEFEKIKKELEKIFKFEVDIKIVDNYYISIYNRYHRGEKRYSKKIEKKLKKFVKNNHNLKLYSNIESFALYPNFLGKEKAMKYLMKKLKPSFVMGAGDSDADLEFIKLADVAIIPTRSNVMKKIKKG